MVLGRVTCEAGDGCSRCGRHDEPNAVVTLVHDLRCWGWATALYNLRIRLCPPAWFSQDG